MRRLRNIVNQDIVDDYKLKIDGCYFHDLDEFKEFDDNDDVELDDEENLNQ